MNIIDRIKKDNADFLNEIMMNHKGQVKGSGMLFIKKDMNQYILTMPGNPDMNLAYLFYKESQSNCDLVFFKMNKEKNLAKTVKKYESIDTGRVGFLFEKTTSQDFFLSKVDYLKLLKLI